MISQVSREPTVRPTVGPHTRRLTVGLLVRSLEGQQQQGPALGID